MGFKMYFLPRLPQGNDYFQLQHWTAVYSKHKHKKTSLKVWECIVISNWKLYFYNLVFTSTFAKKQECNYPYIDKILRMQVQIVHHKTERIWTGSHNSCYLVMCGKGFPFWDVRLWSTPGALWCSNSLGYHVWLKLTPRWKMRPSDSSISASFTNISINEHG